MTNAHRGPHPSVVKELFLAVPYQTEVSSCIAIIIASLIGFGVASSQRPTASASLTPFVLGSQVADGDSVAVVGGPV